MMVVLFKINDDRYALNVNDIVEIIPCVKLQSIPHAPAYVPGLLNYRGDISPVVDVSYLVNGTSAKSFLSSRIILIKSESIGGRHVGLLAEHVTEALKFSDDDLSDTGIGGETTAFIDKVVIDDEGMIRLINIGQLLPEEIGGMLAHDQEDSLYEEGVSHEVT